MTSRRSLRLAAFACAAGLAGVACGSGAGDGASSGDAAAPATTSAPAPDEAAGEPAPTDGEDLAETTGAVPAALNFTAPLIGGGELVGDELAGKPTAFWFWSPT